MPAPTAPALHVLKQPDPLAALDVLLSAVRAAAQEAGFPALEAERRCDALRAACVEEQRRCVEYLGEAWAAPWDRERCAVRWACSYVAVMSARDRVKSMLAVSQEGGTLAVSRNRGAAGQDPGAAATSDPGPNPAAPHTVAAAAGGALTARAGTGRRQEDAQPADDDSAFRPAKRCLDETRFRNFKRLRAVLKANPWIRTRKPSPQRLKVHAGDWDRYLAMLDEAGFDALDVSAETMDAFLAEMRRRQEEIRRRKAGE
jgi:hypothetical protein